MRLVAMIVESLSMLSFTSDLLGGWFYDMKMSLALTVLFIQASMKPIIERNSLHTCTGAITINVCTSKGMSDTPLALRFCT